MSFSVGSASLNSFNPGAGGALITPAKDCLSEDDVSSDEALTFALHTDWSLLVEWQTNTSEALKHCLDMDRFLYILTSSSLSEREALLS